MNAKGLLKKNGVKFIKRFDGCSTDKWGDMVHWCEKNFNKPGILNIPLYGRTWLQYYPTFYFRDEQQYIAFLLRWA